MEYVNIKNVCDDDDVVTITNAKLSVMICYKIKIGQKYVEEALAKNKIVHSGGKVAVNIFILIAICLSYIRSLCDKSLTVYMYDDRSNYST